MRIAVLIALAERWEKDAKAPAPLEVEEGYTQVEALSEAVDRGKRECKLECAEALRTLIDVVG